MRACAEPPRSALTKPCENLGTVVLAFPQAGNRAVGGLLRRRLARAETAEAPGLPSPQYTIPPANETLDYIKLKIDQGLPLYIGVNDGDTLQKIGKSGLPINDAVTDHFLMIVGYTAVNARH